MATGATKTCFVVQGFGEKVDLATGRTLDLDASYAVIKEAVEAAGLRCIRADEIVHSGTIDEPMYQWLYEADLVVADLSTANVNAAYELGVRYGVRPGATIIVAEKQFKNPFDVSHIVIRSYEHLGKDIGLREARRFKEELARAITEIVAAGAPDSPVYTFLRLDPPCPRSTPSTPAVPQNVEAAAPAAGALDQSAKQLLDQARSAMSRDDFLNARGLLQAVHLMRPRDVYVIQQLALATYKSKLPDPLAALQAAHAVLQELDPDTTNDPETLGLWGAVHKRLWDLTGERRHLDTSIGAYERGFYLKQDYYTGINLAFLLNVRADANRKAGSLAEAVTDFVLAQRVRREVRRYSERTLAAGPVSPAERYWIVATMWEAAVGLDDAAGVATWKAQAEGVAEAPWMLETTRSQVERLGQLLATSPLTLLPRG
jgi:hypothetical protein